MELYKVLIVDDIIENLKVMVSVFEKHQPQYEVFQTNNSKKALDIAKQTLPDLIITDWDMPHLSGIELVKQLKEHSETKDIPVIMATGVMLTTSDLKTALEAGAIDYIRKPIDVIELIARTNSALLITKYYKAMLDQKEQELTENSLYLVKVQEFNSSFAASLNRIKELIRTDSEQAITQVDAIKEDIIKRGDEEGWYRFNLSFSKVHKDFVKHLSQKHPNITPSELKLCSFIRLGMANKEIASVLNQSPDSVKVSSYRIRKKIELESSINLRSYLSQF